MAIPARKPDEHLDDERTGDLSKQDAGDHSDQVSAAYEQEFRAGDKLAPFALARVLEIGGTPPDQVPGWLVKYFISLGAKYFADLRDAFRTDRYPSLDRLAGLVGTKPRPWNKNTADLRAVTVAYYFDQIVKAAREGGGGGELICDPAIPRGDPRRNDPSNRTHYADGECEPVRVLDNRGSPTKLFQIALGKRLNVVRCPNAVTDDAIYRAVHKCLKKAHEIRARHGDV